MLTENIEPILSGTEVPADPILCLALDVGEGLLKCGDSVHHVEETIKRICFVYGAVHVETFVISSLVLASVRMPDNAYSSQLRRVGSSSNQLSKLEDYNRLSRTICSTVPSMEQAQQMLRELKRKNYPRCLLYLGGALSAGAFTMLFGGDLRDGLCGVFIGALLAILSEVNYRNINGLAKTAVLSVVAAVLSFLSVLMGLGTNVDMIMIGNIMLLIPGLAFGNALRDLLCGDILTGILRGVQSALTAILIACSFSAVILLLADIGVETGMPAISHSFPWQLLAAVIGTVGFSCFFSVQPKYFIVTAVCGGLTYLMYFVMAEYTGSLFVAAFACAVFGAILSEVCARIRKAPAIVFFTPGIISVVPGGSLYYTMYAVLSRNGGMLGEKASATLQISAGIAVGTMLVTILIGSIQGKKPLEGKGKHI